MKTTTRMISIILVMLMIFGGMVPRIFVMGATEVEPNNDFDHATVLVKDVKTNGSVGPADTADYYQFTVVSAQLISIKFEASTDHLWGNLVYPDKTDADSNTGSTVAGGTVWVNWTTTSAKTGQYYFIVKTNGAGFYNLTLTVTNQNDAGKGIDAGDADTNPLPITNGSYTGRIADDDQVDYYSFVVVNAQIIQVQFMTGTTKTGSLYAQVYDPKKDSISELSTNRLNPGVSQTNNFTTVLTTAGTYYLKVTGGDNDYSFKVQVFNQFDAGISHDASDLDTAPTIITPGTLMSGWIANDDELDIYGFNVVNAQKISLYFLTGTNTTGSLYAEVFDPSKSSITSTGRLNPGVADTKNYTTSSADKGIYYVKITGGDNGYKFKVTITNQNDAKKGIDAMDDFPGIPVTVGKDYPGWLYDGDNKDYFNVNLTNGQMLTVNLTVGNTNTGGKLYIDLYSPTKDKLIATDWINAVTTGSLAYTTNFETSGLYYVLVTGGENDYKFSVDIKNQTDAGTIIDAPTAFEKAINLKTGTYSGWLADADNEDTYNISVKSNHVFTVNFTAGPGGTSDMNLDIYDGAKNKVKSIQSAPDVKATYSLPAASAPLVNTVYYLKVSQGEKKTYQLQVYLPELPPDTTAPTVAITSATTAVNVQNASLTGTATDPDSIVSKVQWSLDNATWNDCTGTGAWACTVVLATGANLVTIKATDPTGNKGYKSITLSFDNVKPILTLTKGASGTVSSSKMSLAGTATDNVAVLRVEVQVNGGGYVLASGTGSWTKDVALKEGKNTIDIRVSDSAGNTDTKTLNVEYKKATKGFAPGFEGVVFMVAVLVAVLALVRRRNK